MSLGELRVGISFNPSTLPTVDAIKRAAADLIDLVNTLPAPQADLDVTAEFGRAKALAMTAFEEGAMWAVKAATRGR